MKVKGTETALIYRRSILAEMFDIKDEQARALKAGEIIDITVPTAEVLIRIGLAGSVENDEPIAVPDDIDNDL